MPNDASHLGYASGRCAECSDPATHHFTEDRISGSGGYTMLSFCCSCYTLLQTFAYKPGHCGESLTLTELGLTPGEDGVWR